MKADAWHYELVEVADGNGGDGALHSPDGYRSLSSLLPPPPLPSSSQGGERGRETEEE